MTALPMIVAKSNPNVHLDWSLDGTSGPFVVKRSLSFTFSNALDLGPGQTTKTFNDGVLGNTTNYAYETFDRALTDTLYFYHADHLGTPIAMTNGAGTLVWRAEHTPFGGIYALTVGTITNNLRFPGQYYDGETGLSQNYFRDYKHNLGRYHEPDPIDSWPGLGGAPLFKSFSQLGSEHLTYPYTSNNPIKLIDPVGLKEFSCEYYKRRFAESGCGYYSWAHNACEWFRTREPYGHNITVCIGQCLQDYDKRQCPKKCCGGIFACNVGAGHQACYNLCFLSWGKLP